MQPFRGSVEPATACRSCDAARWTPDARFCGRCGALLREADGGRAGPATGPRGSAHRRVRSLFVPAAATAAGVLAASLLLLDAVPGIGTAPTAPDGGVAGEVSLPAREMVAPGGAAGGTDDGADVGPAGGADGGTTDGGAEGGTTDGGADGGTTAGGTRAGAGSGGTGFGRQPLRCVPHGCELWRVEEARAGRVLVDGDLAVHVGEARLLGIDTQDGTIRWSVDRPRRDGRRRPSTDRSVANLDREVLVVATGRDVVAYDPLAGSVRWTRTLPDRISEVMRLGDDVLISSLADDLPLEAARRLHVFSVDGPHRWSREIGGPIQEPDEASADADPPPTARDGLAVVLHESGRLQVSGQLGTIGVYGAERAVSRDPLLVHGVHGLLRLDDSLVADAR